MIVINGRQNGWFDAYYIGRPRVGEVGSGSSLANPFKTSVHTVEAHTEVVKQYRTWLWSQIQAKSPAVCAELNALLEAHKLGAEIKLACWCKPLPCHGDVVKACIEWAANEGVTF
jgi:deoxycytidylate deaminase